MEKDILVAIGLPTNRQVKPKTVLSLLNMVNETKYNVFPIVASEGFNIAENRLYVVCQALKNGCTHLFFADDDMTFPPDILDKLMAHGKEVIGVKSYSRCLPLRTTVVFTADNYDLNAEELKPIIPDHLFEVEATSGGCLLIDLSIMDKLEKPWFGFETNELGITTLGEDVWFMRRVKKAGFKVWCDPTITIGHLGDFCFSEDNEQINFTK